MRGVATGQHRQPKPTLPVQEDCMSYLYGNLLPKMHDIAATVLSRVRIARICALPLVAVLALLSLQAIASEQNIVGYIEKAAILPEGLIVDAKMDTGSGTTTIHAIDVRRYDNNGETWVHFVIDIDGRHTVFRRRIIRTISIERAETKTIRRPVVELGVCISGYYKVTHVNLSDRTGFYTQMLVGRPFMKSGSMLVDPASIYFGRPQCKNRQN